MIACGLVSFGGAAAEEKPAPAPAIRSQAQFESAMADLQRQYAKDPRGLWEAQGNMARERQREIEAWLGSNPDSPEAEAFKRELAEIIEELAEREESGFDEVDKADQETTQSITLA